MRKVALLSSLVPAVAVLLLTALAYGHSLAVSRIYDQRMRADIQACAQQLTQAGLSDAQVGAVQSVLNEVNHNTLSYVSSAVDSAIGTAAFIGVIMMSTVFALTMRTPDRTEPPAHS